MLKLKLSTSKKFSIATAFTLLFHSVAAQADSTITLDLQGTLVEKMCTINVTDVGVNLQEIQWTKLKQEQKTLATSFDISIGDCSANVNSLSFKFEPLSTSTYNGKKYINTSGNTGVVLGLFNSQQAEINLDTAFVSPLSGSDLYTFYVQGFVFDENNINPGQYSAAVSFNVSYN